MSFKVDPNPVIGPAITFTPWHPMSFSRGGHIGRLPVSANLYPVDRQRNNILHNELRRQRYDEAFRRQVINPFN